MSTVTEEAERRLYSIGYKKELIRVLVFLMAGEVGVEPTLAVLETDVLPLYYSPICANIFYLKLDDSARYN